MLWWRTLDFSTKFGTCTTGEECINGVGKNFKGVCRCGNSWCYSDHDDDGNSACKAHYPNNGGALEDAMKPIYKDRTDPVEFYYDPSEPYAYCLSGFDAEFYNYAYMCWSWGTTWDDVADQCGAHNKECWETWKPEDDDESFYGCYTIENPCACDEQATRNLTATTFSYVDKLGCGVPLENTPDAQPLGEHRYYVDSSETKSRLRGGLPNAWCIVKDPSCTTAYGFSEGKKWSSCEPEAGESGRVNEFDLHEASWKCLHPDEHRSMAPQNWHTNDYYGNWDATLHGQRCGAQNEVCWKNTKNAMKNFLAQDNDSGLSVRAQFVEQMEDCFRTNPCECDTEATVDDSIILHVDTHGCQTPKDKSRPRCNVKNPGCDTDEKTKGVEGPSWSYCAPGYKSAVEKNYLECMRTPIRAVATTIKCEDTFLKQGCDDAAYAQEGTVCKGPCANLGEKAPSRDGVKAKHSTEIGATEKACYTKVADGKPGDEWGYCLLPAGKAMWDNNGLNCGGKKNDKCRAGSLNTSVEKLKKCFKPTPCKCAAPNRELDTSTYDVDTSGCMHPRDGSPPWCFITNPGCDTQEPWEYPSWLERQTVALEWRKTIDDEPEASFILTASNTIASAAMNKIASPWYPEKKGKQKPWSYCQTTQIYEESDIYAFVHSSG